MSVFLDGVAAQFYRGIGAETQYIAPFGRLNFFIGANNAGKSVVLELIAREVSQFGKNEPLKGINPTDIHLGEAKGAFSYAVAVQSERSIAALSKPFASARPSKYSGRTVKDIVSALMAKNIIQDHFWIGHGPGHKFHQNADAPDYDLISADLLTAHSIYVTRPSPGSEHEMLRDTLNSLKEHVRPKLPSIHLIPSKRVLGEKGEAFNDLSGKGLIDHLAALQNPALHRIEDKQVFYKINVFLQSVTGKPDAEIEVPHTRDHLLVHMDNKVLPLSSLGTGIHEVVLVAAFCTIHDQCIMCIEEPEIHLHPVLQRKLIRYLLKNTENQYFIATHSAAFLDTEDAHVFHVSNDGTQTRVRAALTKPEQRAILDDLGAQASDILQANAVIWVEGPSDRIYLNHWIAQADPELIEGTHYTIMFYGGALIRHLSASDDAVEAFIRLRDLNRHMVVVIDSDRDAEDALLKPHAARLLEEFNGGDGMLWITKGREVENYVDPELLHAALREIHPQRYLAPAASGPFDHAFYFMRPDPKRPDRRVTDKAADKVAVARWITQQDALPDRLDLAERLETLTAFLRRANGMPERGTIEDTERGIEED